jgi:hypothetical protein
LVGEGEVLSSGGGGDMVFGPIDIPLGKCWRSWEKEKRESKNGMLNCKVRAKQGKIISKDWCLYSTVNIDGFRKGTRYFFLRWMWEGGIWVIHKKRPLEVKE